MNTKPHFRVIDGTPREVKPEDPRVTEARKRHGKPFAFEAGTTWEPREVPFLTEWLSQRTREKA